MSHTHDGKRRVMRKRRARQVAKALFPPPPPKRVLTQSFTEILEEMYKQLGKSMPKGGK